MSKNGNESPDLLSSPRIPDQSVGSSVSSHMQQEYDELLKYSVVVPQFNPKIGPQVLENAKGLFLTPSIQIQLHKHIEQQQQVCLKFEEKSIKEINNNEVKSTTTTTTTNNELDNQKQFKPITKQETDKKDLHDDTLDGMSINSSNTTLDSFSPHGLLMTTTHNTDANVNANNNNNNNNNYNLTITTDETPEFYRNHDQIIITNTTKFDTNSHSNDINPRKLSPVPISPPTNIDYTVNAENSLDILLNHNYMMEHNKELFQNYKDDKHINLNDSNQKEAKSLNSLDKWFKEFKAHVLSEFEKSKFQIMQEQQKRLIEEKEKQALDIVKLQKEIDVMKENLNVYEKKAERKDEVINNLTKALEKQREKADLQRVMLEWKLKRVENSREAFTARIAEKFHEQRIKSKAFLSWHFLMANKHKTRVERVCKKKAEEVCLELANKYEEKIKRIEDELRQSKTDCEKYKTEMSKCEENMRKALMRGVCALNLEAMSIFNEEMCNKKQLNLHNSSDSLSQQSTNDEQPNLNKLLTTATLTKQKPPKSRLVEEEQQQQNFAQVQPEINPKLQFINELKPNLTYKIRNLSDDKVVLPNSSHTTPIYTEHKHVEQNTASARHHNLPRTYEQRISNSGSFKQNAKAKVNTNLQNNSQFPYRSIIIEKHTKTDSDEINRNGQVKYIPAHSTISSFPNQKITNTTKKSSLIKCQT